MLTLPGVLGEDALGASVAAALPDEVPPAPWHSDIAMTAWLFRSTGAGGVDAPESLARSLPVGGCAFIHYLNGAVGPYREILATPRCVAVPGSRIPQGSVPFIAVDSLASIRGGRANWALPKLAARFDGAIGGDGVVSGASEADSPVAWRVSTRSRSFGPWFPLRMSASAVQPWPEGSPRSFLCSFVGRARLAIVRTEVNGDERLRRQLPSGRHLGVHFSGTVDVAAPAPVT